MTGANLQAWYYANPKLSSTTVPCYLLNKMKSKKSDSYFVEYLYDIFYIK